MRACPCGGLGSGWCQQPSSEALPIERALLTPTIEPLEERVEVRLAEVIQPGLVEAYSEVDTAFVACTSTVGSRYGRGSMRM